MKKVLVLLVGLCGSFQFVQAEKTSFTVIATGLVGIVGVVGISKLAAASNGETVFTDIKKIGKRCVDKIVFNWEEARKKSELRKAQEAEEVEVEEDSEEDEEEKSEKSQESDA